MGCNLSTALERGRTRPRNHQSHRPSRREGEPRDATRLGFSGNRGEFFDQEQYKGRAILVRYMWLNISPKSARMEQSFSPDGGKSWEVNWICELSR